MAPFLLQLGIISEINTGGASIGFTAAVREAGNEE